MDESIYLRQQAVVRRQRSTSARYGQSDSKSPWPEVLPSHDGGAVDFLDNRLIAPPALRGRGVVDNHDLLCRGSSPASGVIASAPYEWHCRCRTPPLPPVA